MLLPLLFLCHVKTVALLSLLFFWVKNQLFPYWVKASTKCVRKIKLPNSQRLSCMVQYFLAWRSNLPYCWSIFKSISQWLLVTEGSWGTDASRKGEYFQKILFNAMLAKAVWPRGMLEFPEMFQSQWKALCFESDFLRRLLPLLFLVCVIWSNFITCSFY